MWWLGKLDKIWGLIGQERVLQNLKLKSKHLKKQFKNDVEKSKGCRIVYGISQGEMEDSTYLSGGCVI